MARSKSTGNGTGRAGRRVDTQRLRRTVEAMSCGGRILLVDDERLDLDTIKLKLGIVLGPRIEVHTAGTVSTAIDQCLRHGGRFDIYLLNHHLRPSDTGLDLFELLSRCPQPNPVKSVLYSSRMNPSLAREAERRGFDMAVSTEELDSMTAMAELLWRLVKPNIDWSASWRGLP